MFQIMKGNDISKIFQNIFAKLQKFPVNILRAKYLAGNFCAVVQLFPGTSVCLKMKQSDYMAK